MPADADVVLVDDHQLFAQSLELALTSAGYAVERVELVAGASTGPLISKVLRRRPRLLLLDLDLGQHGDGLALIEPVCLSGAEVVVVTGTEEPGRWARALLSGARTVVSKTSPLTEVVDTVDRVLKGLPVLTRQERQAVIDAWIEQRSGSEELWSRFEQLTLRESEVLGLLMQGHAVREVAKHSNTAVTTVRTQVKSVLAKLQVSSQLAAVGLAYQVGWRPPFDEPLRS